MGRGNIQAAYPVGRFDKNLVLQGGSKQMYEFMGEYIYLSLYRRVLEKDIIKLQTAIALCDTSDSVPVEECVHILNENGEYDTFVIKARMGQDFEGYEIELQNVSANIRQLEHMHSQLDVVKDYLTLSGDILFRYWPEDGRFHLFWQNYEQKVELNDTSLEQWKEKVIRERQVTGKDTLIFENFCSSVRSAEHEQTFTFRGSFLTWGQNTDTYRVKFIPREYAGQKVILGGWTIINGQTGNKIDDYIEGTYLDSMTKVLNKKGITKYAEEAVASGEQLALIMLDIDNFKSINDTYGHLFGDAVIAAVADIIKKTIGENGVAGRVGGDEFMVLLDNYGDELGLRNYLRSIKMNISTLFLEKVGDNRISCSIGVSRSPLHSDNFKELYRIADKALYLAKQKGKNCYIIYKEELHGMFRMNEEDSDLKEIREAFYSEKDLIRFNQSLADMIISGKDSLSNVLEQMAHILAVQRIMVIWGRKRQVVCAYPLGLIWQECKELFFEAESYRQLFSNDMLLVSNVNSLEYSMPEVFEVYRRNGTCSVMQHYLRDGEGNIGGFVTVEECGQVRRFPKLAVQLFDNMCRIINAVLLKEGNG